MKMIRPVTVTDAVLVSSTVPETDYAAWSAATTYALGDFVIITSAGTHNIYQSAQAANLNKAPATNPTWWVLVGKTNRWRLFDSSTGTQTSQANSFNLVLLPAAAVTSLAILNAVAANIVIIMTDPIAGVVFSRTLYTAQAPLTGDWDSYFFDYVTTKTDFVVNDLPNYANASISITFNNTGGTAACGVLVVGRAIDLGGAQFGAKFGITDYSVKAVDAYGGYTITKRAFSKRASFDLVVSAAVVDTVAALLTEFRATPAVYIGADQYRGTFIYGFWKDWDVTIAYPTRSLCNLTIEGLA